MAPQYDGLRCDKQPCASNRLNSPQTQKGLPRRGSRTALETRSGQEQRTRRKTPRRTFEFVSGTSLQGRHGDPCSWFSRIYYHHEVCSMWSRKTEHLLFLLSCIEVLTPNSNKFLSTQRLTQSMDFDQCSATRDLARQCGFPKRSVTNGIKFFNDHRGMVLQKPLRERYSRAVTVCSTINN